MFPVTQSKVKVSVLETLQGKVQGWAEFRCSAQVPELHCGLAAHRNLVESWSLESLTCREKCCPSVLSLAVNFLMILSFTFDRICIRELRPLPGSCLNHWKKSKLLSV